MRLLLNQRILCAFLFNIFSPYAFPPHGALFPFYCTKWANCTGTTITQRMMSMIVAKPMAQIVHQIIATLNTTIAASLHQRRRHTARCKDTAFQDAQPKGPEFKLQSFKNTQLGNTHFKGKQCKGTHPLKDPVRLPRFMWSLHPCVCGPWPLWPLADVKPKCAQLFS